MYSYTNLMFLNISDNDNAKVENLLSRYLEPLLTENGVAIIDRKRDENQTRLRLQINNHILAPKKYFGSRDTYLEVLPGIKQVVNASIMQQNIGDLVRIKPEL